MNKTLKIISGIIGALGLVSFLLVQFFMTSKAEPDADEVEYDEFGVGENPYKPGQPQYANWERVKKTKQQQNDGEDETSTS